MRLYSLPKMVEAKSTFGNYFVAVYSKSLLIKRYMERDDQKKRKEAEKM